VAVFLIGPLALALVAGLLGKYPFGGSRLHLYAAPGLALLVAAGIGPVWDRMGALSPRRARFARAVLALLVGWGTIEGATFPLYDSARIDVRAGVEYAKTRPAGCPVVVGDHVFAYYLRHEPGMVLWCDAPNLPAGSVWVIVVLDPRVPDLVSPMLARDPQRIADRRVFGFTTVFRLDPASGRSE
jgi:hypothetical protein